MANRLDTELLITAGVEGLPHLDKLIDKIDEAGGDTDQLREAAEKLKAQWDDLSPEQQAKRLHDLGSAANASAEDVGLLGKSTDNTISAFDRMKSAAIALAGVLGVTFVVGKITSFFTGATKGAADFEQQLATVQAVSGATAQEMARIKKASEDLGKSTRFTATQAAEGFEILARAGLSTAQQLETIPAVLALAQGNALSLSEASGFVTKATQGMGLEFAEAGRVADVLARAAASANTNVSGLGAALSYAAPSAASLGLTIEQTAAYIGKFADAGVDASRAGTAFNSILSQFSNSASSFRRELSNIGITTNNFNDAIAQLAAAGGRGQKAINALGMEAGPAFKALINQGVGSLHELMSTLDNASGAAQAQADVMNNTWQGALASLGSAWDSLKNKLGESFLQPMTAAFKDLSSAIVGLVDSGKIKQLGDNLAKVFADGAKHVIDFVTNLDFGKTIDKVNASFENMRLVGRGVNGAFQALSVTFNVIKSGVLAVGIAFATAYEGIATFAKGIVDSIKGVANVFGITSKHLDDASAKLGEWANKAAEFRTFSTDEIGKAATSIGQSFDSIAGKAEESAKVTVQEFAGTGDKISTEIEEAAAKSKQAMASIAVDAAAKAAEAKQAISSTFDALGLDVDQSLTGVNSKTQQTFDLIATGAKSVADSSYKASEKAKLLAELFAKGLNAAKTKEEFKELEKITRSYGLASAASYEQLKQMRAGMAGGAAAAKVAAEATDTQTKALADNAKQANANTAASEQNAKAKEGQAEASEKAAAAADKAAGSAQRASQTYSLMTDSIIAWSREQISGLENIGITAEQTESLMKNMFEQLRIDSRTMGYNEFNRQVAHLTHNITSQAARFKELRAEAQAAAQALGSTTASSNDLSRAQGLLRRATQFSIDGLVRMDSQTLDGLKSAIDAARQRMKGLADDAKNTADRLEATLAKMRGNDAKAREIEQAKKLAEIEAKLQEARKRGNAEEAQQLQRALSLQKQINAEENRRAKQQAKQTRSNSSQSYAPSNRQSLSADDVASAIDKRIEIAKNEAATEAVDKFAKELRDNIRARAG